jgi:hypothetical protein
MLRLNRTLQRLTAGAACAALALAGTGVAAAQTPSAAWLDGPPRPWNAPGAAIPRAAQIVAPSPQCAAQERGPAGPEEQQVIAAGLGWRLEQYWPIQRRGADAVVIATSRYDGMCRPMGFQAFAFRAGRYAGTLSPTEMDSRADGALGAPPQPQWLAGDQLAATFTRYASSDPLCCPSLPASRVVYRLEGVADAPVVVPVAIGAAPGLPRTGAGAAAWGSGAVPVGGLAAVLAGTVTGLGLAWRRQRRLGP